MLALLAKHRFAIFRTIGKMCLNFSKITRLIYFHHCTVHSFTSNSRIDLKFYFSSVLNSDIFQSMFAQTANYVELWVENDFTVGTAFFSRTK